MSATDAIVPTVADGPVRTLESDKAKRIVDAMRVSVAARGAAGSTFDHVAREAGVSRGLLHYYFGTKERLLVEVVRRDCDIRIAGLAAQLHGAHTADDFIDGLVRGLSELVEGDSDLVTLMFELFTLSRRNAEIADALADLCRQMRAHLAASLTEKRDEGIVRLGAEPDAVAGVLLALADGLALRFLTEPKLDPSPTLAAAVAAARTLIADPA
ncbi:TetR/AcrR family transcriptional regulator [Conexibacter sp. CPCC 206217]|uniref:TetR/AcrR family transcriptional regulator n=1 Tax=Conexibacter sp. CPCC 206217 TaxID=3064574 RepID=UPI002725CCFA|nr:TetR/AcrR family transcriptional regulator [Conexibacter sp. CPCC 206217]MDO8209817.1 TetR/AcrR family transcriptional regulator [Conexibacter sp. CPCC 206217]